MVRLAIPSKRNSVLSKVPTLRAGQAYERRASAWLSREFGMIPQVEFEQDNYGRFTPDGLIFSSDYGKLVVVEIKTQHSRLGEQQLRNYVAWLSSWFPGPVSGLEVCGVMHPFQNVSWELIPTPRAAFYRPFSIFAITSRSLPRMKDGLGVDKPASSDAVSASRGYGSCVDLRVRDASLASTSGAGGTRQHTQARGGYQ